MNRISDTCLERAKVSYLVGISYLLNDVVDFSNGEIDDAILHPFCDFELFDELVFNVRDNLISKGLCLC